MQKNYYQVLKIASDASTQDIAYAYQRMHKRIVDSGIEDPDTLALLKDAHDTLSDPSSRASYDQSLATPEPVARIGESSVSPLAMQYTGDGSDDEERAHKRAIKRIVIILAAAFLTILAGLFFTRKSPPRPEFVSTSVETSTSTTPANATPTQDFTPPSGTQNTVAPKPRTADQVFADVSASVVRVNVLDANGNVIAGGSGVVTARTTVITNCHVALRGPNVTVRTAKQDFPASIEIADETYDLCQLAVGGGFSAPSVEIGSVKYVRPGQKVFAIGSPQGLDLTISEGIVSALRETKLGTIIQTTAPISPGSSGGGLFNVSGQLIGITTFQSKTGQNLNFAVPADWIADMTTREGTGPSLD